MTPDHIKFAPLILPRKTPAEELREIVRRINIAPNYETRESLEGLAARLEAPDAPKRWDGVFPWVSEFGPNYVNVHFSPELPWHLMSNGTCIYTGESHEGDKPSNKSPYHDGVIITITAGSGDEFPRVVKAKDQTTWLCCGVGQGKSIYLEGGPPNVFTVGEIPDWLDTCLRASPLPPGSVTRITISNHGATTEQRYSVEVVEAEKRSEPKEWRVSDKHRLVYLPGRGVDVLTNTGQLLVGIEEEDIQFWCDGLNSLRANLDPQDQPATEAVAEGLPLEIKCDSTLGDVLNVTNGPYGNVVFQVNDSRTVLASPDDEARLRTLLNQRAADGKGGAE